MSCQALQNQDFAVSVAAHIPKFPPPTPAGVTASAAADGGAAGPMAAQCCSPSDTSRGWAHLRNPSCFLEL